jgi:hypothetical protein
MKPSKAILGDWAGRIVNGFAQLLAKLRETASIAVSMMATGCCHGRMGRPRTVDGVTYRVCLDCGMQRLFDPQAWRMYGTFSYRLVEEASGPAARVLPFRPEQTGAAAAGQFLKQAA